MASIKQGSYLSNGAHMTTWTGLTNGEAGEASSPGYFSDRTVQVYGTFGVGGTVAIEGSNNGTDWATLKNVNGTLLTFTSPGIEAIGPAPLYIRPRVTAGDASTNLNVILFSVGSR